jgi:hypothetical protein
LAERPKLVLERDPLVAILLIGDVESNLLGIPLTSGKYPLTGQPLEITPPGRSFLDLFGRWPTIETCFWPLC